MRSILVLFIGLLASVIATAPQKAVIVTYPDNTPGHVIDKAIEAIKDAGGIITHEYSLFKGFAAKASQSTLETVTSLGSEFMPVIEEDAIVSLDGSTHHAPS